MDKLYIKITEPETRKARIEIDGEIGGWDDNWKPKNRGCDIRKELNQISALDVDEIEVIISSLGGDVDQAFQIYDALKKHKCRIVTTVTGLCASAGTLIACAGDIRRISPNSLYLIHRCWGYSFGNANQLDEQADLCRKVDKAQLRIYMAVSKKSEADIAALMDENNGEGHWITAQEALEYGFATEIFEKEEDGTETKAQSGGLMASFLNRAREIYRPRTVIVTTLDDGRQAGNNDTNLNSNQTKKEMKKFLTTFALLAGILAYGAEKEFDEAKGHTLTAEELSKLEEALKAGKQAATDLESVKAQLQAKTDELTAAQAKAEQDKTAIATLIAERDNYKAKYEAMPAKTNTTTGKDPNPQGSAQTVADYVKNDPTYKAIAEDMGIEL